MRSAFSIAKDRDTLANSKAVDAEAVCRLKVRDSIHSCSWDEIDAVPLQAFDINKDGNGHVVPFNSIWLEIMDFAVADDHRDRRRKATILIVMYA